MIPDPFAGTPSTWRPCERTSCVSRVAYDPPPLRWVPGSPVGAGGAFTGGEKLFGPPGVMLFSVGDGATDDVVVVVVLDGLGDSLPPQPAVNVAMAMTALPPATKASRRPKRPDFMMLSYPIPVMV